MSDFVPVLKPSFTAEEKDGILKFTTGMPRGEKTFIYFFLSMMTLGVLFFVALYISMFDSLVPTPSLLDLISLALISISILGFAVRWGIQRTLKHVIEVNDNSITILEGDYNYYHFQKYAMAHVQNLRGSTYPWSKAGAVKFDYGAQTIICGKSL